MLSKDGLKPILVWSGKTRTLLPRLDEDVEIHFDDQHPHLRTVAYRLRREQLPASPAALEEWLLDKTWSTEWVWQRTLERQGFMRQSDRPVRLLKETLLALSHQSDYDYMNLREYLNELLASLRQHIVTSGTSTSFEEAK
ncbi:MAG: hypothetical protein U1D30_22090 [Planctomycetota bacterium]